jgi:hypothetical protein
MQIRSPLPGYSIRRIYVVICETCNEEICRSLGGEEPETVADAQSAVRDHDKIFHA